MYDEIIKRLYAISRFSGKNHGLSQILKLSEALSHPERSFKSIHIAGSNGKGSVALKIAKALEYAGFTVGIYTSPHISSFRERIDVQGELISEEEVVEGMDTIFSLCNRLKIEATFFELATALAFDYFRKKQVDFAVIEAGLGGRLDATNIITPEISVITSISREHTSILGDTLEKIAFEKSGIIKQAVPLVIGGKARLDTVFQTAERLRCRLVQAQEIEGFYDNENKETARAALSVLAERFPISSEAVSHGLCFRPPCRFEKIGNVILDVAHNPDAVRRLLQGLNLHFPGQKTRFVLGLSQDKDLVECLAAVSSAAEHMYLVEAPSPRAAKKELLAEILIKIGYSSFSFGKSIQETVGKAAVVARQNQELVVVCGSFFIMADARSYDPSVFELDDPVGKFCDAGIV
jgi:dihydrofolate synthase / folylpolyglutamate synthase